ncbi:hypothetical protein RY831_03300 [Noviherbaspirillum sp. CPCC 100848]|uniref:Zinc-finger domain-containing protein n=1 Tax=Noviherbaspirillum album TaxID=3080276 RepID=A0ABU6J3H1_9BURK|nr:hypothetical protein [Noviherbaspirillum sp. CPCC 100848]MEC4718159.1 hypothetical protein [Noviherbaspirillum sp. CPCC 100848]
MSNGTRQWAEVSNRRIRNDVEALTPVEREHFEERAGILQHCGECERAEAEQLALLQTRAAFA